MTQTYHMKDHTVATQEIASATKVIAAVAVLALVAQSAHCVVRYVFRNKKKE